MKDIQEFRTSINDPLRVAELSVPGLAGTLGMTICPGKKGDSVYGRPWDRDLNSDLEFISDDWGANIMITLLEEHEFEMLCVQPMRELANSPFRPEWIHLEIKDGDIPDERFHQHWPVVRAKVIATLAVGGKVLIHCRGGLGRTGLVAALLLVETGMPADEAVRLVRASRQGAIETVEQENYVMEATPQLPVSLRQGLTRPLSEILISRDSIQARMLAGTTLLMIAARLATCPRQYNYYNVFCRTIGLQSSQIRQFMGASSFEMNGDIFSNIDLLSRISLSLSSVFYGNVCDEVAWLESSHPDNHMLRKILGTRSPAEHIFDNREGALQGINQYLASQLS